jgi:hypothetical protein
MKVSAIVKLRTIHEIHEAEAVCSRGFVSFRGSFFSSPEQITKLRLEVGFVPLRAAQVPLLNGVSREIVGMLTAL